MEIVLIRHAEPEWVRDGLNVVDPPLTERGRAQANLLANALADQHFDELLVSPLVRARQTAAPVLQRLGRNEVIDAWLEEIRDPKWHGTPAEKATAAYEEVRRKPASERWGATEDGEPVRDFVDRINLGAQLFLAERGIVRLDHDLPVWHIADPELVVGFVAHGGTNSVVISHLLGLDPTPWEWDRFVLRHASVSRLEALELGDGYTFSLTSLSDVEHLDRAERTR